MPDVDADAPAPIRTAHGEYRLSQRLTTPEARRPYWIELRGPAGELVIDWRCFTEADARRVARRLETEVREGVIV